MNSIGSAGVADEQGAPPRSPPRFQFPIWHLVMLALLCAFVAASLRSSKVALIPAFGAILALLFFVIPKTQSVEGAGSLVPSLFAAVGVGLVCAAYYLFSPAHRTYSSLALGLLLVYYAFLPWVMLRLVNSAVLSLLVAAGVGVVWAACYFFSPAHRTYFPSDLALPLLSCAIVPRFFESVRRVYKKIVIHSYRPPPTDGSCGPIGWRNFDEVSINARVDG